MQTDNELDEFNKVEKQKVIVFCKKYIAQNGYVGIGWAIRQTIPGMVWHDAEGNHKWAFIKSVSARLVNTGEYVREKYPTRDDYDVLLNPAYFLDKSVTKATRGTFYVALAALFISLLAFISEVSKSDKQQEKQLQELIQTQKEQVKVLQSHDTALQKIDSSIQKIGQLPPKTDSGK
jgi:hypothetical protein